MLNVRSCCIVSTTSDRGQRIKVRQVVTANAKAIKRNFFFRRQEVLEGLEPPPRFSNIVPNDASEVDGKMEKMARGD